MELLVKCMLMQAWHALSSLLYHTAKEPDNWFGQSCGGQCLFLLTHLRFFCYDRQNVFFKTKVHSYETEVKP